MAALARPHLIAKLPGWAAAGAAALGGAGVLGAPAPWLEAAAGAGGGPGRGLLALGGAALAAAATWAPLRRLCGGGGSSARPGDGAPVLRRADAHPDAPPRRPLSAAELTMPIFHPQANAPKTDPDIPTAALGPAEARPPPHPPVRAVAALAPGERLETFRLAPPPGRQEVAPAPPSIDALLSRLEGAAARRSPA